MDVMGVKCEELFDEVMVGGVVIYMECVDNVNINLFI